jgi:hypothetical protein
MERKASARRIVSESFNPTRSLSLEGLVEEPEPEAHHLRILFFITCRFVIVLAAVCFAVTTMQKSIVELPDHPSHRGNTPTTTAATVDESLAHSQIRNLDCQTTNLAVQAGAAIAFTGPASMVTSGNVCAFAGGITGPPATHYILFPSWQSWWSKEFQIFQIFGTLLVSSTE